MERIKIITDSVSDIPSEYIKKYDIEVVPLTINFGSKSYKDKVDISIEEFYKMVEESEDLPTTSQITPVEFIDTYKKFIDSYDHLIVITMSSKLSGTYQSAVTASQIEGISEKVTVIDSKGITLGQGLLVIEAARMASNGKNKEDIINRINQMIDRLEYIIVVDTLENLKKGGRISSTKAFIGEKLKIKPVLTMDNGNIIVMDKIRGRKKIIKWIIKTLKKKSIDFSNKTIGINHAMAEDMAKDLMEKVKENFDVKEIVFGEVGCTVGVYAGTGAIAIHFQNDIY
ncbi:DegV family protein [Thermohalobacter berrensis]|uniref:Fatty acid-binding protein DegV n=1 Tax=Thermohalobacter berrensis TaxID=99594 RepID=A0A419SV49_9FIRM|nr:DegV family protein [Thermohalobacter berrensis]RKD29096.1 hypothetical protein BET03_05990 [Thermohalobacter berrensis]